MVRDYHRKFPLRLGMPKAEISSKVKLGTHFTEALQKLFTEGVLVEELALVRLPEHQIKLTKDQQNRMDAYLGQLAQNPYSPAPDVVLEPDLLNLLADRRPGGQDRGRGDLFTQAYNEMVARIMAHIKKNGKITLG